MTVRGREACTYCPFPGLNNDLRRRDVPPRLTAKATAIASESLSRRSIVPEGLGPTHPMAYLDLLTFACGGAADEDTSV